MIRNLLLLSLAVFYGNKTYAQFSVTYPMGTSLSAPKLAYSYTDTANAKVMFTGWTFAGNIILNTWNISNGNYPCGTSKPYPSNNFIYLKDLYTAPAYSLCYASGPTPDTIKLEIRESSGTILENVFYVIDPGATPEGLEDLKDGANYFYPNPATNKLFFKTDQQIVSAELLSVSGKCIHRIKIESQLSFMDLSDIPAGLYIVRLETSDGKSCIQKLIRE